MAWSWYRRQPPIRREPARTGSSAPAPGSVAEPAAVLSVGAAAGLGIARGDRGVPSGTLPRRLLSIARSEFDFKLVDLVPLSVGSLPLRYREQLLQALTGGNRLGGRVHGGIIPDVPEVRAASGRRDAGGAQCPMPPTSNGIFSRGPGLERLGEADFAPQLRQAGAAVRATLEARLERGDGIRLGEKSVDLSLRHVEAVAHRAAAQRGKPRRRLDRQQEIASQLPDRRSALPQVLQPGLRARVA